MTEDRAYEAGKAVHERLLTAYEQRAKPATPRQQGYIEYLRKELRAEKISMGELADLQAYGVLGAIDPSDIEMLEAAGVSEWEATGYGEGNPDEDGDYDDCHLYPDDHVEADHAVPPAEERALDYWRNN